MHRARRAGTRRVVELVQSAGFTVETVNDFYLDHGPKFGGAVSLGVAATG